MHWKKKKQIPSVGMLTRPILDSLLLKTRGFGQDFVASWEHIVGSGYAKTSYPLKIIWPSTANRYQQDTVLLVACTTGATQLYLQHSSTDILQRANVFFGYSALTKLKTKQVREISN